jgi:hypothetical protein
MAHQLADQFTREGFTNIKATVLAFCNQLFTVRMPFQDAPVSPWVSKLGQLLSGVHIEDRDSPWMPDG